MSLGIGLGLGGVLLGAVLLWDPSVPSRPLYPFIGGLLLGLGAILLTGLWRRW